MQLKSIVNWRSWVEILQLTEAETRTRWMMSNLKAVSLKFMTEPT